MSKVTLAASAALIAAAVSASLMHAASAQTAPSWGCPTTPATGVTCVNGGGATSSANAYTAPSRVVSATFTYPGGELWQYATANPSIGMSYESASSSSAQLAFRDNLPSLFNGITTETGYNVHFAATDSYVTASTALGPYLYPKTLPGSGGAFIQIPMWGTASTIPINNPKMTFNGAASLTDTDLCGIFSGKLTNWNQTSASVKLAPGPIKVYWRADTVGSGATFVLTQHLAAVCNTSNTASGVKFVNTSTFAKMFAGYTAPTTSTGLWSLPASASNFVGVSGSSAMADGVNNDNSGSAIGYVSPDYTAIAAAPALSKKTKQYTSLFVASLVNFQNNVAYLPTVTNINLALTNAGTGASLNPPSLTGGIAAPATQTNWVPPIATALKGYPIVAYSNLLLAQCYANPTVSKALIGLLTNHLAGKYTVGLQASGFVPAISGSSSGWGGAIYKTFITNNSMLNLNIGNATACKQVTGR